MVIAKMVQFKKKKLFVMVSVLWLTHGLSLFPVKKSNNLTELYVLKEYLQLKCAEEIRLQLAQMVLT